jgi:16S rRNA (adenine1518-N6/adenine1519-N6)-dimethyltransferase
VTGNGNGNGNGNRISVAEALGPFPDARVLLERYGLRAKKSFGQNFLISERALRAIADATVRTDEDWIVEIGAGLGTLTARLAERVTEGKVIALERDPVCGNLPYHIASQILFKVIDAREVVRCAVFMIQKEMADRIVAKPGTKEYGALGVMVRTYVDVSTVIKVSAGSFVPPPKIDSTVIKLTPLPNAAPRVPIADAEHYSKVVHAAFGQRRKTLRNAIRAVWPDDAVDRALAAAELDGGRRGETLDISEFGRLAAELPTATGDAAR